MKWFKNALLFSVLALVMGSCTKKPKNDSPEGALQQYVGAAFSVSSVSDKAKLVALSTGDARMFLEKMSDEDFRKRFIDSKLSLVSFQAKDQRKEDGGDVSLVYELTYKGSDAASQSIYTNKKIAYITQAEGEWKIKATKDVKSFVERKEDLVITPETVGK
jgi:hypothetical protein